MQKKKKSGKCFICDKKSFSHNENTLPVYHFAVLVFPPSLPLFSPTLKTVGFALETHFQYGWTEIIFAAFCQN